MSNKNDVKGPETRELSDMVDGLGNAIVARPEDAATLCYEAGKRLINHTPTWAPAYPESYIRVTDPKNLEVIKLAEAGVQAPYCYLAGQEWPAERFDKYADLIATNIETKPRL